MQTAIRYLSNLALVIAMTTVSTTVSMTAATAQTLDRASPEEVGLDPAVIERLEAGMAKLVAEGRRAGLSWGLVKDGKLVHLGAAGQRDTAEGLPMQPDTIFRIYSMTRAVSTVALLTLVEQGKIDLDAPVASYIPALAGQPVLVENPDGTLGTEPQRRLATVRDLLTYTAGYAYAPQYPKEIGVDHRDILALDQSIADGMAKLARYPLRDQPGARWRYGYHSDVVGRLIEIGSGQRVDDYMRATVFEPLGMADSGFYVPDGAADRLTRAYGDGGKDITEMLPPSSDYLAPAPFQSAGGGLVSTVPDWLRFAEMLRQGGALDGVRILQPETVAEMTRNHITAEQGPLFWYEGADVGQPGFSNRFDGYGWGYGIGVRLEEGPHVIPGNAGEITWGGLANTTWFADRELGITAAVFAQYLGEDADAPGNVLRAAIYGD